MEEKKSKHNTDLSAREREYLNMVRQIVERLKEDRVWGRSLEGEKWRHRV